MVSAWAGENNLVLAQTKVDEKSNEITAVPKLLELLNLTGCIVTMDAMGCQKKTAAQIVDKQGDYLLALKGNQGDLKDDVEFFFQSAKADEFKNISHSFHTTTDGDHGRIEVRKYWSVSDIDWLSQKPEWKGLKAIGMVESQRIIGDKTTTEIRYYITSLNGNDAKVFGQAVRGHWGIENKLHWCLDVAMNEDQCRVRKGHAAENFAVLRHMALNLLKKEKTKKHGIKSKSKFTGWDHQYLLKVLFG
jgi:predicted transposase YbfD/YdcC